MLGDTNKRPSEYRDAVESNVFNLSEAEDLDPVWEALTMQRAAGRVARLVEIG
jgi:hypothetical protein